VEVVTLEHNVLTMLHVATLEALVAIFCIAAVDEVITCRIRCIDIVDSAVGTRERKRTPLLFKILLLCPRTIEDLLPSSLILLLPDFLVEDVVLLVSQVDTCNAALATDAVEHEGRKTAVAAKSRMEHAIAICEIDTIVTKFVPLHIEHIDTIFVVPEENAVEAVLALSRVEDEVAVLEPANEVRKIAIDHLSCLQHGLLRRLPEELTELIEEWSMKIERDSRFCSINLHPLLLVIHGEGLVRRICRDDHLPRQRRRTFVEVLLILKCPSPLLPTVGAKSRWRDGVLLSCKHRGNCIKENKVVRSHLKRNATTSASF
jgi:hypothetical protein